VLLGSWGVQMLIPWLPATFPRVEEIRMNIPVLAFTGCALALTSLLVALWPAMHTTRNDVATGLQEDARTASAGVAGNRVREWLVIGQIALTVVLLAGAGLLIRTFTELKSVNPGFRPAGALSLHLAIPRNRYPSDQEVAALCRQILEQVRPLPGVESAGMVNRLPLGGITEVWSMEFEGPDAAIIRLDVDGRTATPDYFQAIGIPVLQGRSFTEQDGENTPLVAVVDERIARLLWPKGSALSKRLRVAGSTNSWAEIVGVVGHIRHASLDVDERPQVYWNYRQRARDRMAMVVRTAQSPDSLVPAVLAAIRSVDPDQAPYAVRAMSEVLDQSVASRWLNAVLLSIFAGVSLLLASMGLFGVIAWMVNRRTRELGIRLALGAQKRDVLGLVLRQGMKMAGSGIVIGFVGALALTRLLESLLFGVGPTDPVTFAIIPMVLFAVALLACWLPARRASNVDPMEALRCE
jgi:putative ABC transport system permease protein